MGAANEILRLFIYKERSLRLSVWAESKVDDGFSINFVIMTGYCAMFVVF